MRNPPGPPGVVTIEGGVARGRVCAPPSKSYTHRALVAGFLTGGPYAIHNALRSEDTLASRDAVRALGTDVRASRGSQGLWILRPGGPRRGRPIRIGARESGTTLRLFTAVASLRAGPVTFFGAHSLARRPMRGLWSSLESLGASIVRPQDGASLPFTVCGPIHPGRTRVPGTVSSQFLSGLLFALPTLPGPSEIQVRGPLVSRPYVDASLHVLEHHGIRWKVRPEGFLAEGHQVYHGTRFSIPGDASSASYLWALSALTGGDVSVTGVPLDVPQADLALLPILEHLGAQVSPGTDRIRVRGDRSVPPSPFVADVSDTPDLAPLLGVMASFVPGTSRLRGIRRLVHKESDRLRGTRDLVRALGATARREGDELVIHGPPTRSKIHLPGLEDHRMVLSAAVAAAALPGPSQVGQAEAVAKSYPDFFAHLRSLGIPTGPGGEP